MFPGVRRRTIRPGAISAGERFTPTKKYQNEGGPGPASIVDLLRTYSTDREEDVATFIAALGFNWLIAGTDAHAKNYSLLLSARAGW